MEGEFPPYYDHVVRIGVEVGTEHVPGFVALVRGQAWQMREVGGDPRRYDVHIALSGAAFGAVHAALSEFRYACDRAGTHIRIVFATRLRPQRSSFRSYPVLPRARMPEREWLAALARHLLRWRARGGIHARSLAEARDLLPEFTERNPGVGRLDELMVVGPPDTAAPAPGDGEQERPFGLKDPYVLFGGLLVVVGAVVIVLLLTVWRPASLSFPAAVASVIAIPCLFGVWQMLRRVPEGRLNTWLPLALTALAAPLAIALANLSHNTYLAVFGITPGEVVPTGTGRTVALVETLPLVLFALVLSLGIFGFLRHFHLTSHGHSRFLQWLLAVAVVLVYGLTAVTVLMERDSGTGRSHVAAYRSGGGPPRTHAGIQPSVVCVKVGQTPVQRVGPELTTERPVLYFPGANNTDLLWDREDGLTRVPRFSVTLTPVAELDSPCPGPTSASAAPSAQPSETVG
jgi:hypothetical protein